MPKEYIEREAILDAIAEGHGKRNDTQEGTAIEIWGEIKKIPAADVVEVVRCKDCKHLTVHNSQTLYAYCEKTKYRFEPFQTDTRTHFCSYGERKDEGE